MLPPKIFTFADEAGAQIDHQIEAMRRNGLQGLEIRGVDGTNVSAITEEKAKEVRRKLDDAGLITWSIGSPIGKIKMVGSDFEQHLDVFRHTLEVAHILGAANLRLFSFYMPANADPADYKNEVIDRLGRMLEIADGSGVTLCHENEKGIYGDVAPRCLDIQQALPKLGGIFDPANFVQCGQDTWEAWQLLKPYIRYMHIKDALADGSVVPSGAGIGHVPEIVADFRAAGGCHFTLEPHLTVFKGLDELERKNVASRVGERYVYDSSDAAFDAACAAFKKLI